MPIRGQVGHHRPRAKIALAIIYLLLTLGALTTFYPFLVMASTSFKNNLDQEDNRLIPAYWLSEKQLERKFIDDKYAGDTDWISETNSQQGSPADIIKYQLFLKSLPLNDFNCAFTEPSNEVTSKLDLRYQDWVSRKFATINDLNKAYLEEDLAFQTVSPPAEAFERPDWNPEPSRKWSDFQIFKAALPTEFRIPITARFLFQRWMRSKYHNTFSKIPKNLAEGKSHFSDLEITSNQVVLAQFAKEGLPLRYKTNTVETLWLKFNHKPTIGSVLNASRNVELPIASTESYYVRTHQLALRYEFATRDYRYVYRYLILNGRSFWNTILYSFLLIFTTLFVNGIAAYALSRYPIRASAKILIFLLATMAFPTEVAMIPNFLLLKQLHLLNTFSALILPTAASGFMIFLLKGFFDSLPQEVFEAASIDGTPEWLMLVKIAFPLSKPVFGYFALITFFAAYGNFLYAFLVAQNHNMWTVMVFIYQLSEIAPKHTMMAASVIAALPTMIVFLLAQRVIEQGIVLPSER